MINRFLVVGKKTKCPKVSLIVDGLDDSNKIEKLLQKNRYVTESRYFRREMEMEHINSLINKALAQGISEEKIFELIEKCRVKT